MSRCYFCGTNMLPTSRLKIIGKDFGKRKQKTLHMCSCCSAMSDDQWIAEQLCWDEVVRVESAEKSTKIIKKEK